MLKAGVKQVCITPPIGVELAGYGPRLARISTDVHDDLMAQALVLDDGQTRIALITADLISISRECAERVRQDVHARTGIPPTHVMVSCSHVHTAPTTAIFREWGEMDRPYVEMAARYLSGAVVAAKTKLRPVNIAVARSAHTALAWNRAGQDVVDPTVEMVRIDAVEGHTLAILVHYACHPVIPGPSPVISADYPGALRRYLGQKCPKSVVMFANGACGDVDPVTNRQVWGQGTYQDIEQAGAALGADAWEAFCQAQWIEAAEIQVRNGSATLDYHIPTLETIQAYMIHYAAKAAERGLQDEKFEAVTSEENIPNFWLRYYMDMRERLLAQRLPDSENVELQIFIIGDELAWLGIPAEIYTEQGAAIRADSPYAHTLPICYTNDLVGYLPPARAFEEGSYVGALSAAVYDRPPFQPDAASRFMAAISKLLAE